MKSFKGVGRDTSDFANAINAAKGFMNKSATDYEVVIVFKDKPAMIYTGDVIVNPEEIVAVTFDKALVSSEYKDGLLWFSKRKNG